MTSEARSGFVVDHGSRFAALELLAQPFAVLEVHRRRIAPRPDLRLDDDRELDRARPAARDLEEVLDDPSLFVERRAPLRNDEEIEVAARPKPAEDGRTEEIRAGEVRSEDLAQAVEGLLDLLLRRHASIGTWPGCPATRASQPPIAS